MTLRLSRHPQCPLGAHLGLAVHLRSFNFLHPLHGSSSCFTGCVRYNDGAGVGRIVLKKFVNLVTDDDRTWAYAFPEHSIFTCLLQRALFLQLIAF
uniref:Uncharacterized protein n=1 Tax=Trichuris muris TaxID=70415 RepID=A0A5S6QQ37_TRIMR